LLDLSIRGIAATIVRKSLAVQSAFGEAIHFPWLAKKAPGAAVLRTLSLVMRHWC
jgi:hypothetical protein